MQYAVVVGLGDADELAVVALGPHHAAVIQLLHGGRDAEAGHAAADTASHHTTRI